MMCYQKVVEISRKKEQNVERERELRFYYKDFSSFLFSLISMIFFLFNSPNMLTIPLN